MTQLTQQRFVRRLDQAQGYLMLQLPGLALQALEGLEPVPSLRFEVCFLQGEALRQLGHYREAIQALERAARVRPEDVGLAMALGWCYKRTNRLAQAIDALERALRQSPEEPLLHFNLACYWSLAGQHQQALEELTAAIELEPVLRSLAESESDFEPLRGHPEFEHLLHGHPASS